MDYYKTLTQKLIKAKSYKISGVPGTRVDIVRNVVNLIAVHWTSDYLVCRSIEILYSLRRVLMQIGRSLIWT